MPTWAARRRVDVAAVPRVDLHRLQVEARWALDELRVTLRVPVVALAVLSTVALVECGGGRPRAEVLRPLVFCVPHAAVAVHVPCETRRRGHLLEHGVAGLEVRTVVMVVRGVDRDRVLLAVGRLRDLVALVRFGSTTAMVLLFLKRLMMSGGSGVPSIMVQ